MATPEDNMPKDFDVSDFETPAHRILREEFAGLTAINRATLDSFDPNLTTAIADIELDTVHQEAEAVEPDFAHSLRLGMLQQLDIQFLTMEEDQDNQQANSPIHAEFKYGNGSYDQIRHFTRADGVAVPIHTRTDPDYDIYVGLKSIRLLSYELAEELEQRLQTHITEQATNRQLSEAFDLSVESIKSIDMSLEMKQQLLNDVTKIRGLRTYHPDFDLTELKKLRHQLTKRMLPTSKWLAKLGGLHTGELLDLYCEEFTRQVRLQHNDEDFKHDLTTTERNERRELLDRQLHKRRRITLVGGVAMTGYASGLGGVTGYFAAHETMSGATLPAVFLALGIHSGFMYGKARFSRMIQRSQILGAFVHLETNTDTGNEIYEEWSHAQKQLQATRP